MNILHLMKDYKPSAGGSVVRNSKMIENYKNLFEKDNIFIINMEGNKYDGYSCDHSIQVYREKSLGRLVKRGLNLVNKENIEIIQAHNFRFLFAASLIQLFTRKKVRIFVEIHAMYHMNMIKEALSFYLLKKVSGITVLAECAKNYLIEIYNINPDKIHVIRNGVSQKQNNSLVSIDSNIANRLQKLRDVYCIAIYYGSFYEWQGVNFLAEHFDYILQNEKDIFLFLLGDGPEYENVKNLSEKAQLKDRIWVHQNVSKEEIDSIMKYADIVLIPRIKNISTDTAIPLKAIESMEKGKCILASNDNGLLEVLNPDNAEIFDSGNIESFLSHLQILVHDKEHREKLEENVQTDSKNILFSWEENSKLLHTLYEQK